MASKRKQRITPHALLEIRSPGEVHISPDATRVAFAVEETDWDENEQIQHLFVSPTSEEEAARQVTHGKAIDSYPRWSLDGKRLAFLRTVDEDEDDDNDDGEPKAQVWVLPMDGFGGEAEKLTDAKEGVGMFDWLPDSSGIVYIAREPRPTPLQTAYQDRIDDNDDAHVDRAERFRQQIWRIDLEHKKPKLVHAGDYGVGEVAVSPDGKWVAFSTNYTGESNDYHKVDIWIVPSGGGEAKCLTDGVGGKFHPVWTPDSERIFFAQTLDPLLSYSQENVYSVGLGGGEITHETADFPHDMTGWHGFQFDSAGVLYVSAAVGTSTAIYARRDGQWTPLVEGDEHVHEFSVASNGAIAYVSSAIDDAPEVYFLLAQKPAGAAGVLSNERPKPRATPPTGKVVSDLNGEWMDDYEIAPSDLVKWTSPDGLEIEGILTYPLEYEEGGRYPLVVFVHGGPHGRVVQSLPATSMCQLLAAHGFISLSPNYRGSEGYGNEFSVANRGDLGGGDFDDVMAGVDWAIAEGLADGDRVGIIGSSYGGYLVNWAIARTKRFKAAVSEFGIFSLFTDFSNSEAPRWEAEYLGGAYWEVPEEYHRRSPSTYAKDIDTPVLILHGDEDPNTFIANSQELYNALRLQGKTAQFVRYPGEGHGFYEPMHRIDEMRRCLAWFEKYLIGAGEPIVHRVGDAIEREGWELTVTSAEVETYSGTGEKKPRYVEVQFVLRDKSDSRRTLGIAPFDMGLARDGAAGGRRIRPAGLPIDVLGQKSLAEGQGWQFRFEPGKDEPGLTAVVAVAFRITDGGTPYAFTFKDFPPVVFDVAPADHDDKKDKQA